MPDILLGIDLGTTALKAAAFNAAGGRLLAAASERLPAETGPGGRRELPLAVVQRAFARAAAAIRARLGRDWGGVEGIGLAAQGGSAAIVNRASGRPHTPLILWNDGRALPYLSQVTKGRPPEFWRRRTMRDGPGLGLARMLWLREKRPALFHGGNLYAGAGEYAYFRLTSVWRQDACNALQIGCYNVPARRLDEELIGVAEVPLSFVAALRSGHEKHPLSRDGARLLGLPAGIPVAGPYMDHEAGYTSAIGVSRRPLQCSLGTAWVGNFVLPRDEKWRSPFQLVLPSPVGESWLIMQPLLTGNVTWDWALERFVDADHNKALARLGKIFDRALLPPDGLAALPWFNISNPLKPAAIGGGAFFGISPRTKDEDLLRAIAAAMSYEMARIFAEVKRRRKVDSLVLGGGASKGRFFRTLLAALFAPLPVYSVKDVDYCGARGALYAFAPRIARASAVRVPVPGAELRRRVADGFKHYLEVFNRLYSHIAAGGIVTFKDGRNSQ